MGLHKYRINLTDKETATLEKLTRRQTTPQNIVKRAKIILMANKEGMSNTQIAAVLGIHKSDITQWTKRWIERSIEPVKDRISDLPRSGAPCTITPEQWCQIMSMACEPPENYNHPITHWSHRELAREVIKQGIIEKISPSHLGAFLKKQSYNPTEAAIG